MRLRIRERWRTILGYPRYQVSDFGRIRNVQTGKLLKPVPQRNRYLTVGLYSDENRIAVLYYLHRLVLLAFRGPCPLGMQTRHLNGRRADNRLSNLQWATPKRNHQDRLRHGTLSPKLSVDDAMTIRAAYGYAPAYPEPVIAMLAKRYGVTPATIRDIVTRRRWKMDESAILRRELRRDPAVRRHARQAVAKLAEQDCPEDVDRVLADFDELAGPVPSIH